MHKSHPCGWPLNSLNRVVSVEMVILKMLPGFYDTGFVFQRVGSAFRGSTTFFKGLDRVSGFGLHFGCSKDLDGFLMFGSGFRGSSTFFKGSGPVLRIWI
jgi:hypothetical protein